MLDCFRQIEKLKRQAADAEAALNARDQAVKEAGREGTRADKDKRAAEAEVRALAAEIL